MYWLMTHCRLVFFFGKSDSQKSQVQEAHHLPTIQLLHRGQETVSSSLFHQKGLGGCPRKAAGGLNPYNHSHFPPTPWQHGLFSHQSLLQNFSQRRGGAQYEGKQQVIDLGWGRGGKEVGWNSGSSPNTSTSGLGPISQKEPSPCSDPVGGVLASPGETSKWCCGGRTPFFCSFPFLPHTQPGP